MADLDDFFAKKDRKKKSKSKKGFSIANTDILAKNLEENDRKEAKAEKSSAPLATSEANKAQAAAAADEDVNRPETGNEVEEWKTLDDEKKDYSNLKIEALKVDSGSEAEEEVEHEMNEEGEMVRVKKGDGGPWNKQQQQQQQSESANSQESSEKERKEAAKAELEATMGAPKGSVVGGSYVPPHLRGGGGEGGGSSSSSSGRTPRKHNQPLPDINSQVYFPSLSATMLGPGADSNSKGNNFEEVRHGNTQHAPKGGAGSEVALDNKFSALRD